MHEELFSPLKIHQISSPLTLEVFYHLIMSGENGLVVWVVCVWVVCVWVVCVWVVCIVCVYVGGERVRIYSF